MCQLQFIDDIGQKNNWLNEKLQYSIRKLRWYKKKISLSLQAVKDASRISQDNQNQIQPGGLVRVRSAAEINQTLNRARKTRGCAFQKGMYNHCGKEYKVFKKVNHFFDETKQEMRKCNDIYLLEGSYCDGSTAYLRECARNCFYFWHISWLKKV
ncbi:hypothetical protein ACFLUU_02350 [Chloroflexota bacterium]